ncbi:pilus assembly protein CpaF [Silvibacterium bohemicum]|uniref:Pilus assembly protein CpaF n=1 Tax=Silvibacterium bohemicum TaxID=1577686 RepID=A0A841K5W3_9BACT|nr:ATPase, T2SS/T4P/T4SS family [Silvibacterium bohemicum]MBB6147339.1 pilus assembly protein CpaF [Silvibacterium bohemicum]
MSFEVITPFLKPIKHLLDAETVSEIMVNPDSSIWIEEGGHIQHLPDIRFDEGALQTGLEVIANRFGKKLDADSPILNLRLPDGSRMAAMIPPVVNPRPLMTIRKFTSRNFTLADLIRVQMLTDEQAIMLTQAVCEGQNILIAGGTGSGKSTLLGTLADAIPEEERILLIEDTAELHIRKPHIVSTESQVDTHRDKVTFDDLLKAVLRHRPDRIIVGEVRGPEARTLLDAMNTGHRGTLATIHASSAHESVRRLASLASRSSANLQLDVAEEDVKRCIDLVVYISRHQGRRRVEDVLQVQRPA